MRVAKCDAVSRITPSLIGGHRKAPCSSRFQKSPPARPSQATIFSRSPQRFHNAFLSQISSVSQISRESDELIVLILFVEP